MIHRGNRNKKIRSIKRSFDKDKTELENDKNKKLKMMLNQKIDSKKKRIFQMIEGQINL